MSLKEVIEILKTVSEQIGTMHLVFHIKLQALVITILDLILQGNAHVLNLINLTIVPEPDRTVVKYNAVV